MTEFTGYNCEGPGCKNSRNGSVEGSWYLMSIRGENFLFGRWRDTTPLYHPDPRKLSVGDSQHFCGVECLFKRISALTGRQI